MTSARGHTKGLHGVAFAPDGTRLVTASYDGTVRVWDAATGRELHALRGHAGAVMDVAYTEFLRHQEKGEPFDLDAFCARFPDCRSSLLRLLQLQEFVYDNPHMFGTKRTGPDLSRVGGKYDTQWHRTHFRNPRDLVPGSVMPPFPWIANNEQEFTAVIRRPER